MTARPLTQGWRVALVTLPPATPIRQWHRDCALWGRLVAEEGPATLIVPGAKMAGGITYPSLVEVPQAPVWVYVGWRGFQVWRHQVLDTAPLRREDLGAAPTNALHLGARYTWVDATPEDVPRRPVPVPVSSATVIFGLAWDPSPDADIFWELKGYQWRGPARGRTGGP